MSWLTRDWELKLLSLVIASVLWLFVVSGERSEVALASPVEYRNVPAGLSLVDAAPQTVDLRVSGLRSTLDRLTGADVRAEIDLSGVGAGPATVQLGPDSVRAPPGVTIVQVSPPRLRVTLEPVVQGALRVVARVIGTPASGYRLERVTVKPSVANVDGPRSRLAEVSEIPTSPVDVSGARRPLVLAVPLGPPPPGVRVTGPQIVEVSVMVKEEP
jgi:YbbR domain-containing protein